MGSESGRSMKSERSRRLSNISSRKSEDRLSIGEVMRVKRLVNELDREDRRSNIIVRGVKITKEKEIEREGCAEWAKELIREKTGMEKEIAYCRQSGAVIIKLGSEETKREANEK